MTRRLAARTMLVLGFWIFVWNEHDRARWVRWFKNGGF